MLAITEQTACTRVTRKGLRSRYNPKTLAVCGDQELTSTSIRELVPLKLAANVLGILRSKVDTVYIAASVGPLNYDSLLR